jgi:GTP-binding protein HflX
MREVRLASGRRVILSDTVGFISDLPTMLVAAFRATLEEVVGADLILHVRDIAHAETEAQRADVERVLADLGIDPEKAEAPILEVWNKADLVAADEREETAHAAGRTRHGAILTSAVTGEGVAPLLAAIDARLGKDDRVMTVKLPATAGRLLHWLHENAAVIERSTSDGGDITCTIRIAAEKQPRLVAELKRAGIGTE